jgi:hypothetical protein
MATPPRPRLPPRPRWLALWALTWAPLPCHPLPCHPLALPPLPSLPRLLWPSPPAPRHRGGPSPLWVRVLRAGQQANRAGRAVGTRLDHRLDDIIFELGGVHEDDRHPRYPLNPIGHWEAHMEGVEAELATAPLTLTYEPEPTDGEVRQTLLRPHIDPHLDPTFNPPRRARAALRRFQGPRRGPWNPRWAPAYARRGVAGLRALAAHVRHRLNRRAPWSLAYLGLWLGAARAGSGRGGLPPPALWAGALIVPPRAGRGAPSPWAPLPWGALGAPRGPWARGPATLVVPRPAPERFSAVGGGGMESPGTLIRPAHHQTHAHRWGALSPDLGEPEGAAEWGEARAGSLRSLERANWGWGARLYALAPALPPRLTPLAYGRGVAPVSGWVGDPSGLRVLAWVRGVAGLGPGHSSPPLQMVPPAFQLLLLNSLGGHRSLWAWSARAGAPLPARALKAWGVGEFVRRPPLEGVLWAWPHRPPGAPARRRSLAPAYPNFRSHVNSLFRSRWPHLVFGPLTALAVGGRPRGLWRLVAVGQARREGRHAWAEERWLLTLPLGWLDPEAQRPHALHGGGRPGATAATPDRMPLVDQAWLRSEFGASLLLATPRRNI